MSIAVTLGLPFGTTIRRAPKEEAANRKAFDQPDPYATLLACWVSYMRADDRDLGSRGMRLATDAAADRDVHAEQHLADIKIGEAVNATVDSLTIQQRWAIYKSQRISAVWRFANADYEAVLTEAREALEEKLKKNVATRLYFS
jgi:uncharacterized protein YqjF (DUF2071 family)